MLIQVILVAWMFYASVIFGLKGIMATRERYTLAKVTAAHNIFLCLWSLAMFLGGIYFVAQRELVWLFICFLR